MLKSSVEHAGDDMAARKLAEQRVEAARVVEALTAALAADGDDLLTPGERAQVEDALAGLQRVAAESQDDKQLRAEIEALEQACAFYVERRMNSGIRKAMAGHKVDEFE
jgi:molecular chaperone HscA